MKRMLMVVLVVAYSMAGYSQQTSMLSGIVSFMSINLGSKCKWNLHLLLEITRGSFTPL